MLNWLNHAITIDHPDEDVRRRGRLLAILALALGLAVLVVLPFTASQQHVLLILITIVLSGLIVLGIVLLARRGAVTTGGLLMISAIMIGIVNSFRLPDSLLAGGYYMIFAVLAAGLVLRPAQIWLVLGMALLATLAGVALLSRPALSDPTSQMSMINIVVVLTVTALVSFLGAQTTGTALRTARASRRTAEQAALQLEHTNTALELRVQERTSSLASLLAEAEAREARLSSAIAENDQQRTVIREMSLPVIPVTASTLVMPLVGALDSSRLQHLQDQSLNSLERTSARNLVLDVTGVPVVDSQVAHGLIAVVMSARLLGAEVMLVGVRPEVAQTIVGLGLELRDIRIFSDLQSALARLTG
jgi:rsbT co-antagonist protein RsbR